MAVPFILTLAIEENAFLFFNSLRKIYFPAERNFIDAHLTLFHLLPNDERIVEKCAGLSSQHPPMTLQVQAPVSIGNGVAYKIDCPPLSQLHKGLQQEWKSFLILQDQQKLWPHITVQNKVTADEAASLLDFLNSNFSSFTAKGTGLQLWEYHGGPWKLYRQFDFTGREDFSNLSVSQNVS